MAPVISIIKPTELELYPPLDLNLVGKVVDILFQVCVVLSL